MDFLPIFINIFGKKLLIDGGGTIAARRAEMALRAGAKVFVFNPELSDEFLPFLDNPNFTHFARLPQEKDFADCTIIYGASNDENRDKFLVSQARKANILINVADKSEYCDFITPSIVDRSPLIVAISSGGAAPIIARILRARIESLIPSSYGRLAKFLGEKRKIVAQKITNHIKRRQFWEQIIEGNIGDLFLSKNTASIIKKFEHKLEEAAQNNKIDNGEVYLVGAGPGDGDLLTFRALRLMQRCDVVLYDRLVSREVLDLVRRDAERINVGKMANNHVMPQEEISALMIKLAKQGKRVLRLKGGDPFLFGRGGEEIEMLHKYNIDFQIVPGISAAFGAASYAGIPLTHRDYAQSCIFITAHGKEGALNLDWKAILRPKQTIVIYMGLLNLQKIINEFIEHGGDKNTPVALIENATKAEQKTVISSISALPQKVKQENIKGPSLIIIGDVVKLHDKLEWTNPDATKHHKMSLRARKGL